jgi:hypothetical protein
VSCCACVVSCRVMCVSCRVMCVSCRVSAAMMCATREWGWVPPGCDEVKPVAVLVPAVDVGRLAFPLSGLGRDRRVLPLVLEAALSLEPQRDSRSQRRLAASAQLRVSPCVRRMRWCVRRRGRVRLRWSRWRLG